MVQASKSLGLSHSTISGQIKTLEETLGEPLLQRQGRRLEMTEMGRVAYRYADEIFSLGRELVDTIKGRTTGVPQRFRVGVTDAVPKLIVRSILNPVFLMDEPIRLIVEENHLDRLLSDLALHELDVVIADAPIPSGAHIRAYNHLLGQCGIRFCASPSLLATLKAPFPRCLHQAPVLLPAQGTSLRRALDQWFEHHKLHPTVIAELADSALLKVLATDGLGVCVIPEVIASEVTKQYELQLVGEAKGIMESYYAISPERRIRNPAVSAITSEARQQLFQTHKRE